jgi:hypothetical protein
MRHMTALLAAAALSPPSDRRFRHRRRKKNMKSSYALVSYFFTIHGSANLVKL